MKPTRKPQPPKPDSIVTPTSLSFTANARGLKAVDQFHDTAGWSVLLFTACGVGLLAWLLSRLEADAKRLEEARPTAGPGTQAGRESV